MSVMVDVAHTADGLSNPDIETFEGPTRYVPDARARFDELRRAAQDYPDAIASETGLGWMRRKPYDPDFGHHDYFACIYAVANVIQAMRLKKGALVVEVGAGPGWLTQILIGLGYRVVAIEPSAQMIEIARGRLNGFSTMTGVPSDKATIMFATLEEAELEPYLGSADCVLFHESLHHVIDEHASIRRAFELLRQGGCIAVCGEGRWEPGNRQLETELDEEMAHYGTLESPYTQTYLHHILKSAGFSDIVFYHSVNGLYPETHENKTIRDVADPSVSAANTVIAWRRPADEISTGDATGGPDNTSAEIRLVRAAWKDDRLAVRVELHNTGSTYWPVHHVSVTGGVTMALTQEDEEGVRHEASNRCNLDRKVYPGDSVVVDWQFEGRGLDRARCELRLVAEDAFWFETRLPLNP